MTRPIRVLHLIRNLGLGGAETNLLNLVLALDPAFVETHVGYAHGGEFEPRFRAAGVRLFAYARANHRVKSVHTPAIVWRLVRYIRKQRIDIVHTHNFSGHAWGLLAAKLTGIKLVEHVHDFRYTPVDLLRSGHGLIDQYRFVGHFRGRSDRVVVLTRAHREHVLAEGFASADHVSIIPNGVDLTGPVAKRADGGRAEIVILTAARMNPSKNIDLILRIAPEVRRRRPRAVFVIAGSGTHLEAYRAQVRDRGLADFVDCIGFHPDVDALLASADIFLLPSWLELHSIAIIEAMRMRIPVVVSSGVGCNDDYVDDGVNGFLCDPASDASWVETLDRLCASPDLRRAVGARGRETCEAFFDVATTAGRFERLYASLLGA